MLVYAGGLTMLTALTAVAIATVAGLAVGLLAANTRRFAGSVLMRFTDLGLAIPGLLLAAAISTILGRGTLSLIVGLAAVLDSGLYLDVALIYGVLAFVGTVAIARAIEGGRE